MLSPHTSRTILALVAGLCVAACGSGTDARHCSLDDIGEDVEVVQVRVTTTTGQDSTDSDVWLVIGLRAGERALYLDDVSTDNFEPFTTETFVVTTESFSAGSVETMEVHKESSLFEGGDWSLNGLTVDFIDAAGDEFLAYDNQEGIEHMTGDETVDLRCL